MCNNDVRLITNVGGFLGHLNALFMIMCMCVQISLENNDPCRSKFSLPCIIIHAQCMCEGKKSCNTKVAGYGKNVVRPLCDVLKITIIYYIVSCPAPPTHPGRERGSGESCTSGLSLFRNFQAPIRLQYAAHDSSRTYGM